jgi:hypothetical protein
MTKIFEEILNLKMRVFHRYGVYFKKDSPDSSFARRYEMTDPTLVPKALMNGEWKFKKNAGNLYGPGVYTTYDWQDTLFGGNKFRRGNRYSPNHTYGNYIMEMEVVDNKKIFFFDPEAYEDYYENDSNDFLEIQAEKFGISLPEKISSKKVKAMKYNGKKALEVVHFLGKEDIGKFFDGIVYNGETDGHCAVFYNTKILKVLGYHTPILPSTLKQGILWRHDGKIEKLYKINS